MNPLHFRSQDFVQKDAMEEVAPHLVIAIDGPAASGKGTLARKLAKRLGFAHLDTGALYRAVAASLLEQGRDPEDREAAARAARALKDGFKKELLENPAIRSDETGQAASKIAAIPEVRQALRELQQDFAKKPPPPARGASYKGAILDGRDIGTVICPYADVKLYVTADLETRAERRMKELQSRGIQATKGAVLAEMDARDARDAARDAAPMKPAEDAFVLDTTSLSEAEMLDQALAVIRGRLLVSLSGPGY